ncbi:hypothetical protein BGX23_009074 [Mortierella sp. AD031]|nr:hypothetical protein BGX23_009074 [Mortierella sp. AD031]KAG0203980.1 hypothetical protein BGX33_008793 [Mortierella sp. NVP41]
MTQRHWPRRLVAFGDRKRFMSFLNFDQDHLQRSSGCYSLVMDALEMDLVSGLNVKQYPLERVQEGTMMANAAGTEAAAYEAPSRGVQVEYVTRWRQGQEGGKLAKDSQSAGTIHPSMMRSQDYVLLIHNSAKNPEYR